MTARERYDAMLRDLVAPELRRADFRRQRNRFARRGDGGWQVIDFQASAFGSSDGVKFTINLATALEGLPKDGWDAKKPPPEYKAHLRERIGTLLEGQEDRWWQFDASTRPEPLADELLAILRRVGLPWLAARSSLAQVIELAARDPQALGWHNLRWPSGLRSEAEHAEALQVLATEEAQNTSS